MGFAHDRTSLGDLIAHHHDPLGLWPATDDRKRMGRVRFLGFDRTTGEPIYDRMGWDHGGVCWLATWLGSNLSVPVWQQALPGLVGGAPALKTTSGPGYNSKVVGPLFTPALRQGGNTWAADPGLLAQPGALPLGLQLPQGFPGVGLGMSTMDEQQLAIVPAGGILIAVKEGLGQGRFGSLVFDVTKQGAVDPARWARLHSHLFVYLLPLSSPVGFFFAGAGATKASLVPGGLAWELGPSVDGQAGHGVVGDLPSKAGTPATIDIVDGPVDQTGLPGSIGQGAGSGNLTVEQFLQKHPESLKGPTTREKQGGAPGTVSKPGSPVDEGPGILAVATYRGRGPHNVGQRADPHQLATTPDGRPVNSLHTDEGEIVVGKTGDAPRKHDERAWQRPRPDGPFSLEVYHRNDPTDEHEWMGRRVPGLRKWEGTGYEDVPTPREDQPPGKTITGPFPPPPPPPPPPHWPPPFPGWPGGPPPGGGPDPFGPLGPDGNTPPPVGPIGGEDVGPIPPGGYFDGFGRPLYPGFGGPLSPLAPDTGAPLPRDGGGMDGASPANPPDPGKPVEPVNPGGDVGGEDGRQDAYPARGPSMGFYELVPRAAPLDENLRDPRYQFEQYTPAERRYFDEAPAGARIAGFSEQSSGKPTLDGPRCGPGGLVTGTSPRGGISVGPSDFDLLERLRRLQRGEEPRRPRNEALVTFEERADAAWGDTLRSGKPANGFRIGRSYDPVSGAKYMSVDATNGAGELVSETPDVLVDFINHLVYLWGQAIVTTGTTTFGPQCGLFGDGSDGAIVLNGGTAGGDIGAVSGITYTMTRDVYATDFTMSNNYRLITNGWRLFVNGTLTLGASNRIEFDGLAAVGVTPGGAGTAQTVGRGTIGASGATRSSAGATTGNAAVGNSPSFGGSGGNSANDIFIGGAGAGGAATVPAANFGDLRHAPQATLARLQSHAGDSDLEGGAGGGGGGVFYNAASSGTLTGGGGGGGAGVVMISARKVINAGIISADGGPGGAAATTGTSTGSIVAGGGGGGGGLVVVVYESAGSTIGTVSVAGGLAGASLGSPTSPAQAGNAGRTRLLAL